MRKLGLGVLPVHQVPPGWCGFWRIHACLPRKFSNCRKIEMFRRPGIFDRQEVIKQQMVGADSLLYYKGGSHLCNFSLDDLGSRPLRLRRLNKKPNGKTGGKSSSNLASCVICSSPFPYYCPTAVPPPAGLQPAQVPGKLVRCSSQG